MARLVATLASTHHPFYLKATTAPSDQQMPQAPEWKRKVEAYRDEKIYRNGRKVTEEKLRGLALSEDDICPRWNYSLAPRPATGNDDEGKVRPRI